MEAVREALVHAVATKVEVKRGFASDPAIYVAWAVFGREMGMERTATKDFHDCRGVQNAELVVHDSQQLCAEDEILQNTDWKASNARTRDFATGAYHLHRGCTKQNGPGGDGSCFWKVTALSADSSRVRHSVQ